MRKWMGEKHFRLLTVSDFGGIVPLVWVLTRSISFNLYTRFMLSLAFAFQ